MDGRVTGMVNEMEKKKVTKKKNTFQELYLNCKVLFHSSSVDETALHQPTLGERRALP